MQQLNQSGKKRTSAAPQCCVQQPREEDLSSPTKTMREESCLTWRVTAVFRSKIRNCFDTSHALQNAKLQPTLSRLQSHFLTIQTTKMITRRTSIFEECIGGSQIAR